ncbi:hypothetical protein K502DRAFT_366558 [Neoconidiobolus thromboides FSU 785]|nr:hypothetical protein K502DRAFT_366558 [Neoconidiobolus thromboides FSU 785]
MATHMKSNINDIPSERSTPVEGSRDQDLSKASQKTTNSIVHTLVEKYKSKNQTYTKVGSRVLLSINPLHLSNPLQGDSVQAEYVEDFEDFSGRRSTQLPAHIYQLANTTYFHLRRSAIDQSVIFVGDSGSGKSKAKELFVSQLAALRKSSKKESKLFKQLLNSYTVINSFGQAATSINSHASRFGLYTEIQFDHKGRAVGFKHLDYLLERNRVCFPGSQESNFYAFYQLLAGTSADERAHFHLMQESSHYNYLRGTRVQVSNSQLSSEFKALKAAMRTLGFNPKFQSQVFQLLAAILHLGNINFENPAHHTGDDAALIKNTDVLDLVADFLGLHPGTLEGLLTYKTKIIKKEACTVFLDAAQAVVQRDDLARCLYSLLFSWVTEFINTRLCVKEQANFLGLLDLPGTTQINSTNNFQQFCANYANERLYNYICYHVFEASNDSYLEDQIQMPIVDYFSNQPTVQLLSKKATGLVNILQRQANRSRGPATDAAALQAMIKEHEDESAEIFQANQAMAQFTVRHYFGDVTYSINGFMDSNMGGIAPDFVQTFRGSGAVTGNPFVTGLFSNGSLTIESHPKASGAIVSAQQSGMPLRQPSMKRARVKGNLTDGKIPCMASQLQNAMDELFDTFDNAETWFVICMSPGPHHIDSETIREQLVRYSVDIMAERKSLEYTACYQHDEFISRYQNVLEPMGVDLTRSADQSIEAVRTIFGWNYDRLAIGSQFVYLSDEAWRDLEDNLRAIEHGQNPLGMGGDDRGSLYSEADSNFDNESIATADQYGDFDLTRAANELNNEKGNLIEEEEEDTKIPKTKTRKAWICCTWALTWWIPSSFLSCCGRMKLKEVRFAWREKVALCIIIMFFCLFVVAFIALFNPLICPTRAIYGLGDIAVDQDKGIKEKALVVLRGKVYDLRKVRTFKDGTHGNKPVDKILDQVAGNDMSDLFPMQISALCNKIDGTEISPQVVFGNMTPWDLPPPHDNRYFRRSDDDDNRYQKFDNALITMLKPGFLGDMAYSAEDIEKNFDRKKFFVYKDKDKGTEKIYSLQQYANTYIKAPGGEARDSMTETEFLPNEFINGFIPKLRGTEDSNQFNTKVVPDRQERQRLIRCLDNLFYAGVIDDRKSFQCLFAQYLLLAVSVFLFAILFIKFLASLQLGSHPEPEDHDKFVICNVPCYTEGEESLRLTIDSLAALKYDDKRKLLFIIPDGMVIGGGNDLPTPRIVLNLLGADPNEEESEPLSFISLGEGSKQHNMGKVYTGLYECKGHVVPYIVVVKVGKPTERSKPGNRGKRDSQMVLMKFFNKVHYDYPMVPLELEMYHQIKNVIGVDPHFYEFVLMVDADTMVMPDSLNRLVAAMLHDTKVMGICGETALLNETDTWATMIQVYEYYMSHYLAKSFESLFGSVTCLPGCFSMYRLRSADGTKPLLVNNVIIKDYSENVVETLHMKNLLHLGEDRYLTTLMLKHFPFFKMTFTPDAKCLTNAPDTFSVLLSQRRRWINSTVHNLMELVFLPRLCGFCCFSMRFVVFMDLFSTLVMPATLLYLGYIIYRLIVDDSKLIGALSILFLVAPYALQMLVFLLRRQWNQIGWMMIYLCALPVFAFFIPIYSFWHFDDFSWGNTRVVLGDGGKKKKVAAVEDVKFDPSSIPTRKWDEYERDLLEAQTEKSSTHEPSIRSHSPMSQAPEKGLYPSNAYLNTQMPQPHLSTESYQRQSAFRPQSQMSLAHAAPPQYIPMGNIASRNPSPLPQGLHPALPQYHQLPNYPTEHQVIDGIKQILSGVDLMQVTKRQLRERLDSMFQLDISKSNKEFVNRAIELILQDDL